MVCCSDNNIRTKRNVTKWPTYRFSFGAWESPHALWSSHSLHNRHNRHITIHTVSNQLERQHSNSQHLESFQQIWDLVLSLAVVLVIETYQGTFWARLTDLPSSANVPLYRDVSINSISHRHEHVDAMLPHMINL